jgi:hypothetical protein
MKAIIFSTSCVSVDDYKERSQDWLDYYQEFFPDIELLIVNDGPVNSCLNLGKAHLIEFVNHLGRTSNSCFPGWKRSFSYALHYCRNHDYIAHIESDCFIAKQGKDEFLKYFYSNGYFTGFTPTYDMIESGLQIINDKDVYNNLLDRYIRNESWQEDINFEVMLKENYNPSIILNGDRIEHLKDRVKPEYNYLSGARRYMLDWITT